ncbi:MAG: diacylglycerol kinase [Desulfuromonas sp.]|uniref:diacylglycerol kinase n=1 Tax=Desulfuromonas sp. TaxID=892 RepID=UPI000CB12D16|nr:diacylglycerol kinase [Desulfuromonas sp.]PLX85987.1 MAG: diacylglycerol kinase [Desulfuromonas sp.]
MKPTNWLESVNCAIDGVIWAVRTQRHMRYHFFAAMVVLLLAMWLRVSALEFTLLALAATLVLCAELVNTALEVVVDLVSPDYHPLARRAKDVAAGIVLVASVGAVVMGYLILSGHLFPSLKGEEEGAWQAPGELAIVSLLAVTIVVVLLKARSGGGAPLHGGMPSGHSAMAFCIATAMMLSGAGTLLSLMAISLAAMVSHSRLLLGIHSLREVLVGGVLGIMVPLIFYLFLG